MKALFLRGIFRRRFLQKTVRPALLRVVSIVVALQLTATQVFAGPGTNTWQAGDGNWSEGTNWLNQSPPGVETTGEINTGVTVTLDTDPTVGGLTINNGTAKLIGDSQARTVTVSQNFLWSNGEIGTNASIVIRNGGTVDGGVELRHGALRVEGTLDHNVGGTISALSGTSNLISVASAGTYNLRRDNTSLAGRTAGTLVIEAGGNLNRIDGTGAATIDWPVTNLGSIQVQTGTLNLSEGGHLAGSHAISSSAALTLNGGNFFLASGASFTGAGTWHIQQPVDLGSATHSADLPVTFSSGGTLGGSGTFNANSNMNLTGGDLLGTANLNLNHTASITGSTTMEDNVVNVRDNFTHAGSVFTALSGHNPVINIQSNALYDIQTSGTTLSGDSGDVLFNQAGGSLRKSASTSSATVDWFLTNQGHLDLQLGQLSLTEGARLEGSYNIASGATLSLDGGNFSIADGISIAGAGSLNINRPLNIGTGTIPADSAVGFNSGGLLQGSGTYNANSNFVFAGGDLQGSVTMNLNQTASITGSTTMDDNVINIHSNLTHASSVFTALSGHNPVINIHSNALYDIQSSGTKLSGDSGDVLFNQAGGSLRKSVNASSTTIDWFLTNQGHLEIQIGQLSLVEGAQLEGTYNIASGASLALNGGNFTIADGISIAGDGSLFINRPLILGAGTIPANTTVDFNSGGLLQGSGIYNANSNFVFAGGDLQDTVTLNLNHTATLTGSTTLEDNIVNVRSNLTHSGSSFFSLSGHNPVINIHSNSLYDIRTSGTVISGDAGDLLFNHLGGIVRKSVSDSTATLDWHLTNQGHLDLQIGRLSLTEGARLEGTYNIASGATLGLDGGNFTIGDGISIVGDGGISIGSPLNIATGTIPADTTVSFVSGGFLQGSGIYNANKNFAFAGGDLRDTVTVNLNNTATISSSTTLEDNTINIHSNLAHTGSSFSSLVNHNPLINIHSNAVYDIRTSGTVVSGDSSDRFINHPGGTLRKSVNDSTSTFDWRLTNQGHVDIQVGRLSFTEGARFEGTYSVADNATLGLDSGDFTIANGISIEGNGALSINRPLNIGAGTIPANINVGFNGGGILQGSGIYNANSNFSLAGGDLQGTVTLDLNHTATLTGTTTLEDNIINVRSNLIQTGGSFSALVNHNPAINIHSNSIYDIRSSGTAMTGDANDRVSVYPGATLRKSVSDSTTTFDWHLTNRGHLDVQIGRLALFEGARLEGSYNIASGATLGLDGGNFTIDDGISIAGLGSLSINRPLNIGSGTIPANINVGFGSGGILQGSGIYNANSNFVFGGGDLQDTVTVNLNGTATLNGFTTMQGNVVNVRGTLSHTASSVSSLSGFDPRINIANNALYDIRRDGTVFSGGASDKLVIESGGTLRKSIGGGTSSITWGITNAGTIESQIGLLHLTRGLTQTAGDLALAGGSIGSSADLLLNGGVIRGHGTLDLNANTLINSGATVKPGASPGTLNITGNYEQATGATLQIEIDSSPTLTNDLLAVSRAVTLGGNLSVLLLNGTTPNSGDVFTIVTAGTTLSGTFANAPSTVSLVDGSTFDVVYEAQSVKLQNYQAISVVTNAGGTHDWDSVAGWVPQQLPSSTIGAVIANPGSINLNVSPTIAALTLGNASATISGNNTITAFFNWSAGTLSSGTKIVATGGDISGGGTIVNGIDVRGNLLQTGGNILSHGSFNPIIRVLTNGTYDIRFDGTAVSGDSGDQFIVDDGGSLKKSTSAGRANVDWFINNSGAIVVESGELAFVESGSIGGSSTIATNAVLHLDAGTYSLLNGGQVSGPGEFKTTTDLTMPSGVFTVNSPASLATNTTLNGSGTLALTGDGTIGSGLLAVTGVADVRSRVFHTNGAVASHGSFNPHLLISSGGILEYPDETGFFSGDGGDFITNKVGGIIRKSAGNGTNLIAWAVHNDGTIDIQSGALRLNGGGSLGGSTAIATNSVLLLDDGTFNMLNGATATGAGTLIVSATANVPAGSAYDARSLVELTTGGALGGGAGVFAINNTFNINGGTVNSGGALNLNGNGTVTGGALFIGTMNVNGTVSHSAGQHLSHGSFNPLINIRTNGIYSIDMDGVAIAGDSGDQIVIHPGGTLRRAAAVGNGVVDWFVNNQGNIDVRTGTLSLVDSGSLAGSATIASGALLHLDAGTFNLLNGGQVRGAGEFKTTTDIILPAGTFLVNSPAVITTNTTLGGNGTLALAGGGTVGAGIIVSTGTIDVRSHVRPTNGAVIAHGSFNPRFLISSGGILDYSDESGSFSGNDGDFITNQLGGIIRKSGGTGTNLIDWAVHTEGAVDIQTGALNFNEGGSIGGTVTLATNTVLILDNGTFNMLNGGTSTGTGTLIVSATANVPSGSTYDSRTPLRLVNTGGLGGGSGVFAANGSFEIAGGQINNGGSLDLNGNGTVTGGALMIGTINVNGSVSHTSGQHVSHGSFNPRINIRSNGVYSIDMDGAAISGDSGDIITIDAGGTLRRAATSGEGIVDWFVANQGAIDVRTGTLSFVDSGNLAGTSTIADGATWHLDTGTFTLENGGIVGGAGEFRITTDITLASGEFLANSPTLLIAGTTLNGSGTIGLAGGGTVGNGLLVTTGTADVRSRVFHTNGAVVAHGAHNPRFLVSSNGILEYPDESGGFSGNDGDFITNKIGGIIRKSAGTGTNTIDWAIHNAGSIDVQSGALLFNEGGNLGGNIAVASGTKVILENGTFTGLNGGSASGAGTMVISANANVSSGATYDARSRVELVAGGGLGGGSGVFAANGTFDINGGTVNDGGSLDLNGSGTVTGGALLIGTMNIAGTVNHNAGAHSSHGAFNPRINIRSNGVYNVNTDGLFINGNSGDVLTVESGGTLRKSLGNGTSTLNWTINNSGLIECTTGQLNLQASFGSTPGSFRAVGGNLRFTGNLTLAGGRLEGNSSIFFDAQGRTLSNEGTVAPGASAGALQIVGHYQQNSVGKLEIELGGTTPETLHDVLQITGTATLGGSLNVTNVSAFVPQSTDVFTILTTTAGLSGTFDNTPGNILTLPSGDRFTVEYTASEVRLSNFVSASVPPSITQQPASRVAHAGDSVNFTVGASGSNPLLYQWFRNGSAIPNATNAVLNLASVSSASSGNYGVTVSNAVGSVTSNPAQLIVLPNQTGKPNFGFGGTFGTPTSESANAVFIDDTGNFYFAGGFSGTMILDNAPFVSVSSAGAQDALVVKFNSAGDVAWARTAGGSGEDEALDVAVDTDGNVYVVGEFASATATFGTTPLTSSGSNDMFVAKYSPSGNLVWVQPAGGANDDTIEGVTLANGAVFITGSYRSPNAAFGTNTITNAGDEDGFIARYSTNGNAVWARSIGGSATDQLSDIAADAAGYLYAVGQFNSTNLANAAATLPNAGSNDVLVVKYDANGNRQWLRGIGGSGNDAGFGVAVNHLGIVGIGGEFDSPTFVFSTNDTLSTAGQLDGFIGGIGTNGIPQGALQVGGTGPDGIHSVAADGAGNFIIAGYSGSQTANFGSLQIGTFSPRNAFAAKLGGSGGPEWIRSLGGLGSDEGIDIATGRGLEIIMTGETTSPTLQIDSRTLTNAGNVDIFFAGLTNDSFFITDHPQSMTTNSGTGATFSVNAVSSQAISYQWRHNGSHLSGQTSSNLTLVGLGVNNSGAYDVVVTSGGSSLMSAPAELRVDNNVRFGGVNFPQGIASFADVVFARGNGSIRPTSEFDVATNVIGFADDSAPGTQYLSLGRGGSVTVQFTDNILTGSGDANLDLWIFEIGSAVERSLVEVSSNGVDFISVGAVSGQPSGIDIDAFGFGINSQLRYVRVTDDPNEGPHSSGSPGADIDAIAAITSVPPDPLITLHPVNTVATSGSTTGFSVSATGTGPLFYQWFRNASIIPSATNAALTIPAVTPAQAGNYHVVISNSLDTATSATATLTVNVPPAITTQPSGHSIILSAATGFSVTATGTAPLHYQWRKDGSPIANATNASFNISSVTTASAGNYSVLVTNIAGTVVSSDAQLVVLVPPQILSQPTDQIVSQGANATFTVSAGGSQPLHYSWRRNGIPLNGATNASLVISNATFSDIGSYNVVVTNVAGSRNSTGANLNVVQFPIISEQPQSRIARNGASVIFRVAASAATTYQWRRNGTNLPGATDASLTLHRVGTNNVGNYNVLVGNPTTNILSATATLTVSGSSLVSTVGAWPDTVRGETFDTFYTNGFVYTADGAAGLKIYALTNGNSLVAHGAVDTDGSARSVFVSNGRAYIADGEKGLKIFDVSDSHHPQLLGTIDTPVFARDVFVSGNLAYIADLETGLLIVDVSNPAAPARVARHDTPGRTEGVHVAGGYAYLADMAAGLHVLSITNPASPTRIGTLDTDGYARSVQVVGTTAYVADWSGGLRLINVSNPASPTLISETTNVGLAYDVKVVGATVYLAAYDSGLRIVDAGNSLAPSVVGTLNTAGLALGVDAAGSMAFVADWAGGLQVVNVSTPANPTAIAGVRSQGSAFDTQVVGNHAYIADFGAGLQIVHISDPTTPTKVGQLDTAGSAVGLHIDNQTAYVADYHRGLLVIDVSNPASPIQRGDYDTAGYARDVVVKGNHAYVADDISGLQVIDISSPTSPNRAGGVDTLGTAYAVHAAGNYLYVADFERGLQIFSITNPVAPVRVGGIDTDGQSWDVQLIGNFALVADGTAGLKAFNISDPTTPTLAASVDTSGTAVNIDISGNVVAVADWDGGLLFYDLSNPASPALLESYDNGTQAAGVHIVNNYAYIASRNHGLTVLNTPGRGGFTPLLTSQPQTQTINAGGTAAFLVNAIGSPTLRYQWQRNGTNISGATNRGLVITSTSQAHAGVYQVEVSNEFGRVISGSATLTVDEFEAGSNTGATSAPTVVFRLQTSQLVNGTMELEFGATSNQALDSSTGYRVQSTIDLLNWTTLPGVPRTANGLLRVSDPDAGIGDPCRFYRVIRE